MVVLQLLVFVGMSRPYVCAALWVLLQPLLLLLPHLLGQPVLIHMVAAQSAAQQLHAVEVVHRQYGGARVLVLDECKAFGLVGGFVSHEVDVLDLPPLAHHAHQIALGQLEGEPAQENPRTVFVLLMPGALTDASEDAGLELLLRDVLDPADVVHGLH
eukprot:CAMPEP_0173298066 /NCGR_PEP_ID=MMETSP1143-20121109/15886_1 /TAXON_ID=483371 /ORGANISM="non described non described, Strain CCMP2298" /LENGTH=157 /DNA_ID=CAMNT_0014238141 /DNA_START=158 /DNA_END=631 /DNA_ORIENTATION=-